MSDTTWISSTETKSGIAHSTSLSTIGSLPYPVNADSSRRLHEGNLLQIAWDVLSRTWEPAAARNILCCGAISFGVGRLTMSKPTRDKPWLIRTYAGHSTAAKSNELYRTNLARGQTGLSVAFDLPTQTG